MFIITKYLQIIIFKIYKVRGFLKFKTGSKISSKSFLGLNVQIFGLDNTKIEDYCTIGENSLLIVNDRTNKEIKLSIKKNVYLGRNNFISVGKSIEINSYCVFGDNCSLISAGKIYTNPLIPYFLSGIDSDKSIIVGSNCWFGVGSSVIGNVKIGHGSIIGAYSVVTKDIPPFSMVVGNPAKIIKRFNFDTKKWEKDTSDFNSEYYIEEHYLEKLNFNHNKIPLAFHASSSEFGHL
jgi:acetyltransferase-like isoleucine patch superfamily enzyme